MRRDSIMRIRDLMTDQLAEKLMAELEGEIEIDETYTSAGQKGTKCEKRPPRKQGLKLRGRGTYGKDKPPVLSLVERGGKIILRVAKDLSNRFVRSILRRHVKKESEIYHDEYTIYDNLPEYVEFTVRKKKRSKGKAHTNTVGHIFSA